MNHYQLAIKANQYRMEVIESIKRAGKGHLGGALSAMEIMTYLFHAHLRLSPKQPNQSNRDRFILSKGHIAIGLYPILADLGFFPRQALKRFNCADGYLGEHPDRRIPGIEINAGSLGHGLGIAVGMALAHQQSNPNIKHVVLLGDGECYEGSIWESALFASHHGLSNLLAIVDRNQHCVQGKTESINRLEPLKDKWQSFGWNPIITDGHHFPSIADACQQATHCQTKPSVIIAQTIKGKGISFMENQSSWHHGSLDETQYQLAYQSLHQQADKLKTLQRFLETA